MKKYLLLLSIFFIIAIASHKVYAGSSVFDIYGTKCPSIHISNKIKEKKNILKKFWLNKENKSELPFSVFFKGLDFSVMPDTIPDKSGLINSLNVSVTAGEYEPAVFCIRSEHGLDNFHIEVTDLLGNENETISKQNISVNYVKLFPHLIGDKKYRLRPLILERLEFLSMPKQYTKQIWINIYVPPLARPGTYKGYVYLKDNHATLKKLDLKVTVLPFRLGESKRNYGMYYYIDSRWKGFYPENMMRHFLDMKCHGLNTVAVYVVPYLKNGNDNIIIDFDKPGTYRTASVNQLMETYLNSGFNRPIIFMGLDSILKHRIKSDLGLRIYSNEFDKVFVGIVNAIESQIIRNGWPEFIYSPTDEPAGSQDRMKMCKYYLKLFKAKFPENKTYLALNGLKKGIDDGAYFDPWLNIRCYAFLNQELIDATRTSGDGLWVYNGGSFGFGPRYDRLFFGFYAEKIKADGVMQWAYQWPATLKASPYDEISNNQQGWYYAYPSEDGPLPTIGWEAIREGIDDARYVQKLRDLIDKAACLQDVKLKKESENSQKVLESTFKRINVKFNSNSSITYNDMYSWRVNIIEEIIKLQKLTKSKD